MKLVLPALFTGYQYIDMVWHSNLTYKGKLVVNQFQRLVAPVNSAGITRYVTGFPTMLGSWFEYPQRTILNSLVGN